MRMTRCAGIAGNRQNPDLTGGGGSSSLMRHKERRASADDWCWHVVLVFQVVTQTANIVIEDESEGHEKSRPSSFGSARFVINTIVLAAIADRLDVGKTRPRYCPSRSLVQHNCRGSRDFGSFIPRGWSFGLPAEHSWGREGRG